LTEYQVEGGLDWQDLQEAFRALARFKVIGLEVAEYEASWPDGTLNNCSPLIRAIEPLLAVITRSTTN
jgi:arginase